MLPQPGGNRSSFAHIVISIASVGGRGSISTSITVIVIIMIISYFQYVYTAIAFECQWWYLHKGIDNSISRFNCHISVTLAGVSNSITITINISIIPNILAILMLIIISI